MTTAGGTQVPLNIAEIFVYPIKSLRGTAVDEALVCGYGLEHDRHWMLIDGNSRMITQRALGRRIALISLPPSAAMGGASSK